MGGVGWGGSEEPITASMNADTSAATFIDGRNGRGCYSVDALIGPFARSSAQRAPEGCDARFMFLFIYLFFTRKGHSWNVKRVFIVKVERTFGTRVWRMM